MRWSGIAFTSERTLAGWGLPYRRTSLSRKGGWSEPSGTIVHGILEELGIERRVVLWNIVPTHPHRDGQPLSNRRPGRPEIDAGLIFVERIIRVVGPRTIVAVGRVAQSMLGDQAAYVRHPAQSGATQFRTGMRALLGSLPARS